MSPDSRDDGLDEPEERLDEPDIDPEALTDTQPVEPTVHTGSVFADEVSEADRLDQLREVAGGDDRDDF